MTAPDIRVGFIGVGDMGGPIAQRIIDAGFPTTLWARREASLARYRESAAKFAKTPRELAAACDVVGLCVFDDTSVRDVLLGTDGILAGLRKGGVIVLHSTISVEGTEEFARLAADRGIRLLDAPVSGARTGAENGRLAIMVGGDASAFEAALPVMRSYGATIELMGPTGSGQKTKVLNNVLGFCNLRMAYLALQTGERLGLEAEALKTILRNSSGSSFNLTMLADRLLPDPSFARHASTMTVKDTNLFKTVREQAGIERSLLDQLAEEAIGVVTALGQRSS
jgi:3-hydroxyisobutyrate dehydrogenase-like beta-hydroxyacid dehydrogenase